MLLFGLVAIMIYTGLNVYIIMRAWQFVSCLFVDANKKVFLLITVLLALLYLLSMAVFRDSVNPVSKILLYVGSYYLLVMMYSFIFLVTIDIVRLISKFVKPLDLILSQYSKNLTISSGILIIITILVIITVGSFFARIPRVTQYDINLSKSVTKLGDLKIVMLSDLHLGQLINRGRLKVIVDKINSLNPDIVMIVGDIIDGSRNAFVSENMGEEIKRIKSKYGVFGVVGNHEYFGENFDESVKVLRESGIKLLIDEEYLLEDSIYIVGGNDKTGARFFNNKRAELKDLVNGNDTSKPIILMDHQPSELDNALKNGIDLQFSGHTHHGQVWPSSLITQKIFEIDWGHKLLGSTNIVVSCGVGTWGPPVRIGSYSEIVEVNLKFKNP